MDSWELLWKITFFAGVSVFAGMAVWVTFQGARDIKSLFRTLNEQHDREDA